MPLTSFATRNLRYDKSKKKAREQRQKGYHTSYDLTLGKPQKRRAEGPHVDKGLRGETLAL